VFSSELTHEMLYMQKVSDFGFDGDWKWWDGKAPPWGVDVAVEAINAWYRVYDKNWKYEDDLVRCVILAELASTRHIAVDFLYYTLSGLPSGSFITCIINCLINIYMLSLAFIVLTGVIQFSVWKRSVALKTYGDDNKNAVVKEYRDKYNGPNLTAFFAEFGYDYTPAAKSGEWGPMVHVANLEYLKVKCIWDEKCRLYYAHVNKLSVDSSICWVKKSKYSSFAEALQATIDSACYQLFFYGRHEYERYCGFFEKVLREHEVEYSLRIKSYDMLAIEFVTGGYFDVGLLSSNLVNKFEFKGDELPVFEFDVREAFDCVHFKKYERVSPQIDEEIVAYLERQNGARKVADECHGPTGPATIAVVDRINPLVFDLPANRKRHFRRVRAKPCTVQGTTYDEVVLFPRERLDGSHLVTVRCTKNHVVLFYLSPRIKERMAIGNVVNDKPETPKLTGLDVYEEETHGPMDNGVQNVSDEQQRANGTSVIDSNQALVITPNNEIRVSRLKRITSVVDDQAQSYTSMANKWYKIHVITWDMTSVNPLMLHAVPYDLLRLYQLRQGFENMVFWSGGIELMLTVNSTQYVGGSLSVGLYPLITKTAFIALAPSYDQLSELPHQRILLSHPTPVTVFVPFSHPMCSLDLARYNDSSLLASLGVIWVYITNPLSVADGTTPVVTVSCSARLTESLFKVPRSVQITISPTEVMHGFLPDFIAKRVRLVTRKVVDTALDGLKDIAHDGIDAITSMDHIEDPYHPRPVMLRNAFHGAIDLPHPVEPLEIKGTFVDPTHPEHLGTDVDDMAFDQLLMRQPRVATFPVDTTATGGTLLYQAFVTPAWRSTNDRTTNSYYPTAADILCMMTQYWRGRLKLIMEMVGTQFQAMELVVAFMPGRDALNPTITDAFNSYYAQISLRDVNRRWEFEIPFVTRNLALETSIITKTNMASGSPYRFTTGVFAIFVGTPLTAANGTPGDIYVNLFLSCSDCQFFGLKANPATAPAELEKLPVDTVKGGRRSLRVSKDVPHGPVGITSEARFVLGPEDAYERIDHLNGLPEIKSFRDLFRCFMTFKSQALTSDVNVIIDIDDIVNAVTFRSFIMKSYRGYRGSLNLKHVIQIVNTNTPRVDVYYDAGNIDIVAVPTVWQLGNMIGSTDSGSNVVCVPYTANTNYSLFSFVTTEIPLRTSGRLFYKIDVDTAARTIEWFWAGGDDFRLISYVGGQQISASMA